MKDVYTIADLRDWQAVTADEPVPIRLAVIGDPVAHSRSPQMHNAALTALGLPVRYTRLHILPGEVEECLSLLPGAGFLGLNCTIPHKGAVLAALPKADAIAQRAGGVNTVSVAPDGTLSGTSTDGPGFAHAVRDCFGRDLGELRVMILGAGGGAGRAVAMQCASEGCELMLINRSLDKLDTLLEDLAKAFPGTRPAAGSFDEIFLRAGLNACDLIVNCSAVGMKPSDASPIPAKLLTHRHLIYDTIYVGHRTPLLVAGDSAGAKGANGLSMLLHQGALSFERWFQQPAPLEAMRATLM